MALQASTLVNGQWVTTTFGVDDILKAHAPNQMHNTQTFLDVEKPPTLGILTQTVIRSPLVHWILQVKFRRQDIQDVAFIGDDFVEIKELCSNGQFADVIRRDYFGIRIRNACVVGSLNACENSPDIIAGCDNIKIENDSKDREPSPPDKNDQSGAPPRQFLLLMLENGDSVFLMLLRSTNGEFAMVTNRHRAIQEMRNFQPGMHLAVDPSSRYAVVGCFEGIFAIYELCSARELENQILRGSTIRHVEAVMHIFFDGVILKMDFLYPSKGDEKHVILLLLVVSKGRTRMQVYEWNTGNDIKNIRARSRLGHVVEESRRLPQLLIPLRTKSAFILVCEDSMAICEGLLEDSPTFIDFNNHTTTDPTGYHHGSGPPLWTAWARPIRLPERLKEFDDIYLAREDGIIKFLEVDMEEANVVMDHNIGELGANCGSAMTCLDCEIAVKKEGGDLFVTGGDGCVGGTYLVQARKVPSIEEPLHNWSPSQDFVTICDRPDGHAENERANPKAGYLVPKPDRIFACSGKGLGGAINELRYGLQATIGTELDHDKPISGAWILYPDDPNAGGRMLCLLSVEFRSELISLCEDMSEAERLGQGSTNFDLQNRTIMAAMEGSFMVQVTERSIVLISPSEHYTYRDDILLDIQADGDHIGSGPVILDAAIGGRCVFFTTYLDNAIWLQALDIKSDSGPNVRTVCKFSSAVSSLAIGNIGSMWWAIVADWNSAMITLSFVPVDGGSVRTLDFPGTYGNKHTPLGNLTSLAIFPSTAGNFFLLCGSRNGVLIILEIDTSISEIMSYEHHIIGATSVLVIKDKYRDSLFFVNCDSKVYAIRLETRFTSLSGPIGGLQKIHIHQVWLCSKLQPDYRPPEIVKTARLRPDLTGALGESMLFVAGFQLIIARLNFQPTTIPRTMKIECTPMRLMYSSKLNAFVVAAIVNDRSSLQFRDPDTGCDLSEPVDAKNGDPLDYVSGLGNQNERILCLSEWTYVKEEKSWYYIIVATSSGPVLVISIDNLDEIREETQKRSRAEHSNLNGDGEERTRVRFRLKWKFKEKDPATAIIGHPDGLIRCNGTLIQFHVLNLENRKFESAGSYQLPSPAVNLRYEDGKIYALTKSHSLEILQLSETDGVFMYNIQRTHIDPLGRPALHHAILNVHDKDEKEQQLHLISDKLCSVAGLWASKSTKADILEPVFTAQLPHSIIRFRLSNCRPVWDPAWILDGRTPIPVTGQVLSLDQLPSPTNTDLLGLSITGALTHFTILSNATCEFLRFLINLALRSPAVCEFTYERLPISLARSNGATDSPKSNMHIDGEVLRRCLSVEILFDLVQVGVETDEASLVFSRFLELLQALHMNTLPTNEQPMVYIEYAYIDLLYILRPVI